MFSGKSTELFRLLEREMRGRKKVCLLRPKEDTRTFLSHSKSTEIQFNDLSIPIFYLDSSFDLSILDNYDAIGIDELQFIETELAKKLLFIYGSKNIYATGLLATSECKMFPTIIEILPFCEEIIKLNAVCSACGSQIGNYTHYLHANKTTDIVVGDSNDYEARCKDCYFERFLDEV